jgi:superfamily II DNA or RNA helicase
VLGDLADVLDLGPVLRLLVIGDSVPTDVDHGTTEVRLVEATDPALPSGIYRFDEADGMALLNVEVGQTPGSPVEASWDAPDDHPLINAFAWMAEWWEDAAVVPRPRFSTGDEAVTVPEGQEARVRTRRYVGRTWMYRVRVEGRTIDVEERSLAEPDTDDDPNSWILREPGDVERFAATLTRAKLGEQLTDTVFSFRATKTIFRPYQFRPVVRLLETGSLRLLIADEVGLGKTIEAGLVWTELDARKLANRVLIVCPSMLVPKWKAEMELRFGFDLTELTRDQLNDFAERVETDRLPNRYHVICSIERLRIWKGLERMAELAPRFDLVIADEAHAFRNSGTKSNALGVLLSDWADALVFLSATPLNLGNDDLYNLLELLAPGEFDDRAILEERLMPNAVLNGVSASLLDKDVSNRRRLDRLSDLAALTFGPSVMTRPEFRDLTEMLQGPTLTHAQIAEAKRLIGHLHALSAVVTRTRKVEIQEEKAVREAISIHVEWTPAEAEFYVLFDQWQRARAKKLGMPVGFVTQMPLRLASTCLPAARQRILDGSFADEGDLDAAAHLDEEQDIDDPDRPPPALMAAARSLPEGVDTKFDAFLERLLPVVAQGKQVLVFTFSRVALAYLHERLQDKVRVDVLHGGVEKDRRQTVMRRFRDNEFDVLLASRVASEGLDFEFCSAVVNYDLPWNPMEVEQRIGRIDRFGQTEEKVLILNFHTPGTIETDIIERVHQRIGVFSDSIGELEPIIQSKLADLKRVMFDFNLTDEQRDRRINEMMTAIEEQRHSHDEVENASAFLSSTDQASIDGFEDELVSQGRYVGQPELALLIKDWVGNDEVAGWTVSDDGRFLQIRGTAKLASELMAVKTAGERSSVELEELAIALRDERTVTVCLDQETARTSAATLMTANHPMVRAALRVPGDRQIRFSDVTVRSDEVPPGRYLALISLARWTGIRPSVELWSSAVSLDHLGEPTTEVGALLLAALAEAQIGVGSGSSRQDDLLRPLQTVTDDMWRRQIRERERRTESNDALVETRRLSLTETYSRKRGQIQQRIRTMRERNRLSTIHLHQAQLANQDRQLEKELSKLDETRKGSMSVEALALATVTVEAY